MGDLEKKSYYNLKNNGIIFPQCPSCHKFYTVSQNKQNKLEVVFKCDCDTQKMLLEDWNMTFKKAYSPKECDRNDKNEEIAAFCFNCSDWLCKNCFKNHQNNKLKAGHRTFSEENALEILGIPCKEHPKGISYCFDCKEHFCSCHIDASSKHKKNNHECIRLEDYYNEKMNVYLGYKLQELKGEVDTYNEELFNKATKKINSIYKDLKETFDKNKNNNEKIFNYVGNFLDCNKTSYFQNYFIYKNILNNCRLKFSKLENFNEENDNITVNDIDRIIKYFQKTNLAVTEEINLCFNEIHQKEIGKADKNIQICITKDEKLVTCFNDKELHVYDLSKNEFNEEKCEVFVNNQGNKPKKATCIIEYITYIKDKKENFLISGTDDGEILVWGKEEEETKCIYTKKMHNKEIKSIINLGNQKLASCSKDNTIKIFNFDFEFCSKSMEILREDINFSGYENEDSKIISATVSNIQSMIALEDKKMIVTISSGEKGSELKFWDYDLKVKKALGFQRLYGLAEIKGRIFIGGCNEIIIVNPLTFEKDNPIKRKEGNNFCAYCFLDLKNDTFLAGIEERGKGIIILFGIKGEKYLELKQFTISKKQIISNILIDKKGDCIIKYVGANFAIWSKIFK